MGQLQVTVKTLLATDRTVVVEMSAVDGHDAPVATVSAGLAPAQARGLAADLVALADAAER